MVHNNITYKNQKMGITQKSINRSMDKLNGISYNGILLSSKEG